MFGAGIALGSFTSGTFTGAATFGPFSRSHCLTFHSCRWTASGVRSKLGCGESFWRIRNSEKPPTEARPSGSMPMSRTGLATTVPR